MTIWDALKGSFPVSETAAVRQLSLPMFPTLTADAQRMVADRIREFVGAVAQTASGVYRDPR